MDSVVGAKARTAERALRRKPYVMSEGAATKDHWDLPSPWQGLLHDETERLFGVVDPEVLRGSLYCFSGTLRMATQYEQSIGK